MFSRRLSPAPTHPRQQSWSESTAFYKRKRFAPPPPYLSSSGSTGPYTKTNGRDAKVRPKGGAKDGAVKRLSATGGEMGFCEAKAQGQNPAWMPDFGPRKG
jgi:hypothetical protein